MSLTWKMSAPSPRRLIGIGRAVVDLQRQRVYRGRGCVGLTRTEGRLLAYLSARPGAVVRSTELQVQVLGYREGVTTRAVAMGISRLRSKLGAPGGLETLRRQGYRLQPCSIPGAGLVGRDDALASVLAGVAEPGAVCSITGPPGVGRGAVAEAVRRMLDGLGWPSMLLGQTPSGLPARLRAHRAAHPAHRFLVVAAGPVGVRGERSVALTPLPSPLVAARWPTLPAPVRSALGGLPGALEAAARGTAEHALAHGRAALRERVERIWWGLRPEERGALLRVAAREASWTLDDLRELACELLPERPPGELAALLRHRGWLVPAGKAYRVPSPLRHFVLARRELAMPQISRRVRQCRQKNPTPAP